MSLTREAGCRYQSESVEDTERFGELVAAFLNEGDVLILTGGLGVGKTHFTKGCPSRDQSNVCTDGSA